MRKIFVPQRDEVRGEWRKLHNEELDDLYSTPNIICVIKSSRRIRWAGMQRVWGERRCAYMVWWENLKKETYWKT